MKKDEFIKHAASNSMSLTQKRELARRLEDDYYRNNPSREIEDHKKGVIEVGIPALLGATLLPSRGIPGGNVAVGLTGGVLLNRLGAAGRRQEILREMGVDTDLLNTRVEPINEQAKEKYFKN